MLAIVELILLVVVIRFLVIVAVIVSSDFVVLSSRDDNKLVLRRGIKTHLFFSVALLAQKAALLQARDAAFTRCFCCRCRRCPGRKQKVWL